MLMLIHPFDYFSIFIFQNKIFFIFVSKTKYFLKFIEYIDFSNNKKINFFLNNLFDADGAFFLIPMIKLFNVNMNN